MDIGGLPAVVEAMPAAVVEGRPAGQGATQHPAVRISARIRMDRRAPGSGVSWGPPVLEEELLDREGDRERGAHVLRPRLDRHVGRSGLGGVVQGLDPAASAALDDRDRRTE